jgi:hypothetical protein
MGGTAVFTDCLLSERSNAHQHKKIGKQLEDECKRLQRPRYRAIRLAHLTLYLRKKRRPEDSSVRTPQNWIKATKKGAGENSRPF